MGVGTTRGNIAGFKVPTYVVIVVLALFIVALTTLSRGGIEMFAAPVPDLDCYVINLPRNVDRLRNFKTYYGISDLSTTPLITFEAVDGKQIDVAKRVSHDVYIGILETDATGKRASDKQLTRGMIGCYLSHIGIYKKIIASGKPYAVVFEDDAIVPPNIYEAGLKELFPITDVGKGATREKEREMERKVETSRTLGGRYPSNWDIILLGYVCLDCDDTRDSYVVPQEFWCTHCYVITREGAEKMLRYADGIDISLQIDGIMSKLSREGKVNIYGRKPQLVRTDQAFYSDIQLQIIP